MCVLIIAQENYEGKDAQNRREPNQDNREKFAVLGLSLFPKFIMDGMGDVFVHAAQIAKQTPPADIGWDTC